jgi:hypothetical protein
MEDLGGGSTDACVQDPVIGSGIGKLVATGGVEFWRAAGFGGEGDEDACWGNIYILYG